MGKEKEQLVATKDYGKWIMRLVGRALVIIVESHALFCDGLALLLKLRMGCECIQAGSLVEARRILDTLSSGVDLAVVDLDLPEGDATALIEDLHELDVPVLAVTSSLSLERQASALRAGAREVLTMATAGEKILDTATRLIRD
jgi:DNA-binding NarL/FixJ family response regulator